jgi:hypothetical protein
MHKIDDKTSLKLRAADIEAKIKTNWRNWRGNLNFMASSDRPWRQDAKRLIRDVIGGLGYSSHLSETSIARFFTDREGSQLAFENGYLFHEFHDRIRDITEAMVYSWRQEAALNRIFTRPESEQSVASSTQSYYPQPGSHLETQDYAWLGTPSGHADGDAGIPSLSEV